MEAVNLLSSNKYTEKQIVSLLSYIITYIKYIWWIGCFHLIFPGECIRVCHVPIQGYLFISVLVNSNSDLIRLINNGIKNDLSSRNPTFMNLALHCIANVGSREMAEAFASEIPSILVAGCVQCVNMQTLTLT